MAKKKTVIGKEYVLSNGEVYTIIGDDGKYYICECGTQFRKSAKRGVLRDPVPAEKETEE